MTVPGQPTIRSLAQSCHKNLEHILNSELPDDQYSWARECQFRLQIFSDLLRVSGKGDLSVEHRLRTNPSEKYVLILLLEAVFSKIQLWVSLGKDELLGDHPESLDKVSSNALGILQNSEHERELLERIQATPGSPSTSDNEEEQADTDNQVVQPESNRPDTADLIERVLASLINYAAFIKSQNHLSFDLWAEEYEPKDESGQSLIPSFMASARTALDGKLSEFSEFSQTNPEYATENELRVRFGDTILKRWRNLCYCKYGAKRLAETPALNPQTVPQAGNIMMESFGPTDSRSTAPVSWSEPPQKPSTVQREETTSMLKSPLRAASPMAQSASTAPMSVSESVTERSIHIVRPTNIQRCKDVFEFVCPLCHIPLRVVGGRDELRQAWKKHAIRDLAPYICLYAKCPTANAMYRSLDDWTRHVEAEHIPPRLTCRECSHGNEFETETVFQNHLREHHDETLSDREMEYITAASWQRTVKLTHCILCGSTGGLDNQQGEFNQDEKQLHNSSMQCMAQHMLSIARISLPEDSFLASKSGDSNENGSC